MTKPLSNNETAGKTGNDNLHGSGTVSSPSFLALLITQWLTAINDNAFRWLVIGIGKDYVSPANVSSVLMAGTACFILPYLILAAPAGYLADRFSKRNVIVLCKIAEIVVMALGVFAIWYGNFYFLLFVVALMGAQSALFSPAKMGTIPELVATHQISAANGWFGLFTVSATLIGMAIGNALADFTGYRGLSNLWLSGVVLVGIAVVGTLISFIIKKVSAADPSKKFPWFAPVETFRDLATLFSYRKLFAVCLGKVFFWSVAVLAQLNIDQFSSESGGLLEFDKIPFLVSLVFGVGMGSVLAGIMSAGRIELGMLWIGALGISIFGVAVYFVPQGFMEFGFQLNSGYLLACFFLLMLGASAGVFDVPLSSYLQEKSPRKQRGAILSANNFMLFSGMMLASILFGTVLRTPARHGSDDYISQKYFKHINQQEQASLWPITARFARDWRTFTPISSSSSSIPGKPQPDDGSPKIESYLEEVKPELKRLLLAELLWEEMQIKREKDLPVIQSVYNDRFAPEPDLRQLSWGERKKANIQRRDELRLIKDTYEQTSKLPLLDSRQIFMLLGLSGLPVLVFVLYHLAYQSFRFVTWRIVKFIYSVRITNSGVLPEKGAVLISNRCSNIDFLLLSLSTERTIHRVINDPNAKESIWKRFFGEINIGGGVAKRQSGLAEARKALGRRELLLVSPETELSSTGQFRDFDEEYMKLISVSPVPVIPVYFDGLWGSWFSHNRGRGFWDITPNHRRSFKIKYGNPLSRSNDKFELRQAIIATGATTRE